MPEPTDKGNKAYTDDQIAHFMELFQGNTAGFGKHKITGDDCKNWSATGAVSDTDFIGHVEGGTGIGIVPIMQGNVCRFSCIDFDEHHQTGQEVDYMALSEMVALKELPLVVCRSKSGGAHLFAFYAEAVPAAKCKQLMSLWASALEISGASEIFPKQTRLRNGHFGNTINLPYFGISDTNRFAIINRDIQPFGSFLEACEERAIHVDEVDEWLGGEHAEAPPCLQHLIQKGCPTGLRNETMYNLTVYMKKRYPNDFKDRLYDMNMSVFAKPLATREARRTIQSASRVECHYRCNESPCRDHCNKDVCLDRQFGITEGEADDPVNDLFNRLRKHNTQPVQWELVIKDMSVYLTTHMLMDYKRLMEEVAEVTSIVLPLMKNAEWLRFLEPMMKGAEVIAAPEDSTTGGLLLSKLREFVRRARIPQEGMTDRSPVLRGQPVAEITPSGDMVVHFQGRDFIEFLRRARHGEVRANIVWIALKRFGVSSGRIRVGANIATVWSMRADINEDEQVIPTFSTEF